MALADIAKHVNQRYVPRRRNDSVNNDSRLGIGVGMAASACVEAGQKRNGEKWT